MKTILFVLFVVAGVNCDVSLSKESKISGDVSRWPSELVPLETNPTENEVSLSPYQLYNMKPYSINDDEVLKLGEVGVQLMVPPSIIGFITGLVNRINGYIAIVRQIIYTIKDIRILYYKIKPYIPDIVWGFNQVMEFLGFKSKESEIYAGYRSVRLFSGQVNSMDENMKRAIRGYYLLLRAVVQKFLNRSTEEMMQWSLEDLEKYVKQLFGIQY